jgi:GntR family transcriptional repressor for pyruvate dehydrogenase complex
MGENMEKPLVKVVSEEIIDYIQKNGLKPGDRLPSEYELSGILGAGRSTVREAVKILISRNILEIKRGTGTFVSEKKGMSDDPLGLVFVKESHKMAEDLMAVRFMIEPDIAAMAAKNAVDEDIEALERLRDEIEEMICRGENHLCKDIEFHSKIALSSKNIIVPRLVPIIHNAIQVFMDETNRELLKETVTSHREIVEAIRKHDGMEAYDAMYLHLVYNRKLINQRKGKR